MAEAAGPQFLKLLKGKRELRFRAKYGAGEIERWYSKLDVAVEITVS